MSSQFLVFGTGGRDRIQPAVFDTLEEAQAYGGGNRVVIISVELLEKLARIKELGASDHLINICLKKAGCPYPVEEIRTRLRTKEFRQIYLALGLRAQDSIDELLARRWRFTNSRSLG